MTSSIREEIVRLDTNKLDELWLYETTQSIDKSPLAFAEIEFIVNLITKIKVPVNDKLALIDLINNPANVVKESDNSASSFNNSTIYLILSNVSIPSVYYKHGTKYKSKPLARKLQLLLLEWLISNINHINKGLFTLNQCLPILLSLLSFEYLRPQIVNLIAMAILKNFNFKTYYNKNIENFVSSLKNWHIDLVIELFKKFPLDDSLKWLVLFFRSIKPSTKFDAVSPILLLSNRTLPMTIAPSLKRNGDFSNLFHQSKRRKLGYLLQLASPNELTIDSIHSVKDLIYNFSNIHNVTVNSLFDGSSNKFRTYYVLLHMLSQDSAYHLKLDYIISFSLASHYSDRKQLQSICDSIQESVFYSAGNIKFPLILSHVLSPILSKDTYDKYYCQLYLKFRMLSLISNVSFSDYDELFFRPTMQLLQRFPKKKRDCQDHQQLVSMFIRQQLTLFNKWYLSISEDGISQENAYIIFNTSLPEMYKFLESIPEFDVKELLILNILDFVKSIDIDHLNRYIEDEAILIGPSLICKLFFSVDPFVCSQICGYINHCKNYDFKSANSKLIYQQLIKDIINFIWRDKPFHQDEKTKSNPFLLDSDCISKLKQLPAYNFSYMLNFNSTGSIFHNPAWSYITAQIIWQLEDKNDSITIRHQGPITQSSVANLNSQSDEIWLNWNHEDVKLNTLKQLDQYRFNGLCDLLFNSLKSLANKRNST